MARAAPHHGPLIASDRDIFEKEMVSNSDPYARQVDTFSAAIEGNSEFPVLGEEGWQNQEVLDAAYRHGIQAKAGSVGAR